jgi:putative addiction module component (TIGR02574 family)
MKSLTAAEVQELPVDERIRLVEMLWDSLAIVPDAFPISDSLAADLDQRYREFEADPEAGLEWNEVRERVVRGTWRTD